MAKRKSGGGNGFDDETIAAKIPLSEMVVDEYQGHVNHGLVKRIADKWDDSAAGAIILNLRDDNTYAVLDGQHRVLAAKQVGVPELSALVFIGKTKEEEAQLFVKLNTKHNVGPIDRFRANLVGGGTVEKNVRAILREVGLEVGLGGPKDDEIRAVGRLTDIYSSFGGQHLKMAVGVLTSAFHGYPDRQRGYSAPVLDAVSQFVYRYPEASIPRLIEKMRQTGPTVLLGTAEAKRDPGVAPWISCGKVLTGLYNAGYRTTSSKYLPPERWTKKKYTPVAKANIIKASTKTLGELRAEGKTEIGVFKKGHSAWNKGLKLAAKTAK